MWRVICSQLIGYSQYLIFLLDKITRPRRDLLDFSKDSFLSNRWLELFGRAKKNPRKLSDRFGRQSPPDDHRDWRCRVTCPSH